MTRLASGRVNVTAIVSTIPDVIFTELLNDFARLATECPEDNKSLPFNRYVGSIFPYHEIATIPASGIRQEFILHLLSGPPLRWFSVVAERSTFGILARIGTENVRLTLIALVPYLFPVCKHSFGSPRWSIVKVLGKVLLPRRSHGFTRQWANNLARTGGRDGTLAMGWGLRRPR